MSEGPTFSAGSATTREKLREIFSHSGFRWYFAARMTSQLGDGLFQLSAAAVLLFEHAHRNPALDLLAISAVTLIPFSVIGPFTGVFIDRWERSAILTRVPLMRAALSLLLPLAALAGTHGVAFYAVVLVVLSANRFFLATMSAVLPQLVPEGDLLVANSASTTGGAIANVGGQGLGAAAAALIGGERAAVFAAVAFGVGALVARRVPVHRGLPPQQGSLGEDLRAVIAEMREGVRDVARNPRVVYALSAIGLVQLLVGAMVGVLVFYFIHVLGLKVGSATSLLAVLAIGIGAGVLFVPLVARRIREDVLVTTSFAIAGTGALLAAGTLSRATLIVGTGVVGISYAFAKIPVDTIVQEEMADEVRGRAFSFYDMLFNLARVGGLGVVAWLYAAGVRSGPIVAGIGVVYLAAVVPFWLWERRTTMRKKRITLTPEDLLQAGELITVRAYSGHRADEEPRALVVGGRELPVRSIDWRAVVEENGRRARVFVVRVGAIRVRLANYDDDIGWQVERVMPPSAREE
jgi:MFS family permease